MNEKEHDINLMGKIRDGDTQALAKLYDRHATKLMRVIYTVLQNRQDAEDLLHDIFMEAWDKSGSYSSSRGSVLSWLIVRSRSRAIDRKRSQKLSENYQREQSHIKEKTIQSELDRTLDDHRLHQAISHLPVIHRDVVLQSYFQGLTYKEISQYDGIPMGTVKSRMAAAVSKLNGYFLRSREELRS